MILFRRYLLLAFVVFFGFCTAENKPLDIVIVGGGPGGLATAIEAKLSGASVTIVEKREQYIRNQYVFLWGISLDLILNRWDIKIPEFFVGNDNEDLIGLAKLKNIEMGLSERCAELGIRKISGEFVTIEDRKAVIKNQDQLISLSYDILVGADGENSTVRNYLNIDSEVYGKGVGLISIIHKENTLSENNHFEFLAPIISNDIFINRINIPFLTIISGQGPEISKSKLYSSAISLDWNDRADDIYSDETVFFENIDVSLRQALKFSSQDQATILLGDAAATGSFLIGMGANCALEEAFIAGEFFRSKQEECDYQAYNVAMKEITDILIDNSSFLFR